jgi:hypothetical protein
MTKIIFTITTENEKKLREQTHKQGDLSNTINQALKEHFKKAEK